MTQLFAILLVLLSLGRTLCQTRLASQHNITCPFSSDCQCSSTQCIGAVQVWCTSRGHFPTFTANSNCEVNNLEIEGEFDRIPDKALAAFTDRISNLKITVKSTQPLKIDPQAFQGSIGLFLETFQLHDHRSVTTFPSALKAFKKLHTLILENTSFTTVPAQTLSDKILETLRIGNGAVKEIDRDAFLNLPFLFNLEMPRNNLTLFPRDALLPVMPSLRNLDLSFNQIVSLESGSVHGFDRLKMLNLSGNPLAFMDNDSLSGLEESLTFLDLSKCQLTTFPSNSVSKLKMLKTLDLGNNRIEIIPNNALGQMSSLSELKLQRNPIKTIEIGALAGGGQLQTFNIYGTSMEELDLAAFAGLKEMTILLVSDNAHLKKVYSSLGQAGHVDAKPIEVHLYRNDLQTLDKSITGWLTAGAKIITDGNDHFDCNQTSLTWLTGAYKCFDTKPLVISNTWCAADKESEELYENNRTSLISILDSTSVDCRRFFQSAEARTTLRPVVKDNSAASIGLSVALITAVLLKSLVNGA